MALGLAGCGGDAEGTVRLDHVADVSAPTAMATRAHDPSLYVAQQDGQVLAIRGEQSVRVLDLRREVRSGGEQGLLGLTFSPSGNHMYVDYTDESGFIQLVEHRFRRGRAVPATARVVLRIRHPAHHHYGGQLAFGPDGMLYIGTGDGVRGRNAQSLRSLLGKVLRIDPRPSQDAAYSVPRDNPFVGRRGALGEIWAYGLRNPWRFSFDRKTGDLWIGDVGEGRFEEINLVRNVAGGRALNFGWNQFEGTGRRARGGLNRDKTIAPLVEISHARGDCAVIGGFVYRGAKLPELAGAYLFSDYCNGDVRWLRQSHGTVTDRGSLDVSAGEITSFGEDPRGELLVLSREDGLLRLAPG